MNEILRKKGTYYAYEKIEPIRHQLLRNKTILHVEDYGAGSRKNKSSERRIADIARYSVMPEKYAFLMHRMAVEFKPEHILEIGTSLGITTMYLASASSHSHVYTIEGSTAVRAQAVSLFNEYHFKNIQSIPGKFDDVLPSLVGSVPRLDFVLVDGNHQKTPTWNYFLCCLEKSHNNTIFVFDDIHWSEEMEEVWEMIKQHDRVSSTIDLFYMGIVFLRKELQKEHFNIRF